MRRGSTPWRPVLMAALLALAPGAARAAAGVAGETSAVDAPLVLAVKPVGGAIGAPEVAAAPGAIVIGLPGARLEHSSTMAPPVGSRLSVFFGEIGQQSSRTQKRATVTLRLRDGVALRPEQLRVTVSDGALRIGLLPPPRPVTATAAATPPVSEGAGAAAGRAGGASVANVGTAANAALPTLKTSAQPLRAATGVAALSALGLLGIGALLLLRRRQGLRLVTSGEGRPASIDIVASRAIGRTQRLLVVDVEQQRFLLSASEAGGLRLVSPIGDTVAPRREGAPGDDNLGEVFEDMLASVNSPGLAEPRKKDAAAGRTAEPGKDAATTVPRSAAAPSAPARKPVVGTTAAKSAGSATATAPTAAAPSRPAAPRQEGRPALHLVEGSRPPRPTWTAAALSADEEPQRDAASAPVKKPRREGETADGDHGVELPPRSSDVAGLVALRQGRQGGRW